MMLPVKPYVYRSWSISFAGPSVYAPHHRAQWLGKITQAGVRRRAELLCQQLDGLQALRQTARHDLLAESRNGRDETALPDPYIGPIRAALLIALTQNAAPFRTKRQLWASKGLALEKHSSGEHRYVQGQPATMQQARRAPQSQCEPPS
jgi:transposase